MNQQLSGKTALVTGATGAIGTAVCDALARCGVRLALVSRSADRGQDLAEALTEKGVDAAHFATDITDEESVRRAIEATCQRFGGLDLAVNAAGTVPSRPCALAETEEADWWPVVDVNLRGTWACLKHEIRAMADREDAAIVNVASMMGLAANAAGISAYVASKHAVVGLTRAVALENARSGLRINAVCPAFVRSPILDDIAQGSEVVRRAIDEVHPLGRVAETAEVANAVVWLLSPSASFVTGVALPLDGGCLAERGTPRPGVAPISPVPSMVAPSL